MRSGGSRSTPEVRRVLSVQREGETKGQDDIPSPNQEPHVSRARLASGCRVSHLVFPRKVLHTLRDEDA